MTISPARPTLDDVASAAQVSKSTVSKVLNGRPRIGAATRRRVLEAAQQVGYALPAPTPAPQAPAPSVAAVFETFSDMYATRVLEGILGAALEHGVDVVTDALDLGGGDLGPLTAGWFQRQEDRRRTGLILVATELSPEQRALVSATRIPAVHIDPIDPLAEDLVSVSATNYAGGVQATRHLVDLGHRRIAHAGGPPDSVPARERLQGYLATLSVAGIAHDGDLVTATRFHYDAGLEVGERFLSLPDPPTAVVAGSDATALGILEAARRRGVRVPDDLSVVGFDDTYGATSSTPQLTTVRQPITEMGRVALRTLLQQVRGEAADAPHVQLSTQLVVRASTAAPPRHFPPPV